MKVNSMKNLTRAILLIVSLVIPIAAQNTHIEVGKRSRRIPKSCELLTPATIEGTVDIPALVKEAICKGAGDMMVEYTYTVNSLKREKQSKGKVKDETFVYEVFIPTLKSGMSTKGILVVTSHNGVTVPPAELEKDRLRAAEKIEKEEERIERSAPVVVDSSNVPGLVPLGMYTRSTMSRSAFGVKNGGATFAIASFLRTSDLVLARRKQVAGRDTLILDFTPRPGVQFSDNEQYMAQLTGEIWIDAVDRIVTRVVGWPPHAANGKNETNETVPADQAVSGDILLFGFRPPAVYLEMMRLPERGIWLPHVIHMNGADYPKLFDGIKTISTSIYSNYFRFSTEVKDVEVAPPKTP